MSTAPRVRIVIRQTNYRFKRVEKAERHKLGLKHCEKVFGDHNTDSIF